MGDLNAHTGSLQESVDAEQVLDCLGMGGLVREEPIPPRTNSDARPPDAYGQELVRVCQETGMLIGNGRAPGDAQGASTFFGVHGGVEVTSSVIDYCLVDAAMFGGLQSLIIERPPWQWGDHALLTATLAAERFGFHASAEEPGRRPACSPRVPRWDAGRKVEYGLALSSGAAGAELCAIHQGVLYCCRMSCQRMWLLAERLSSLISNTTACRVCLWCGAASAQPGAWQASRPNLPLVQALSG